MDDLFTTSDNATDPNAVINTQSNDPFAELVGEGKRYKSPQDLAKGKVEADAHIKKLEREQAELRAELAERLTAEERAQAALDAASQSQDPGKATPQSAPRSAVVDPKAVEDIVRKALSAEDLRKERINNLRSCGVAMTGKFGSLDKAKEVMKARGMELGMDEKSLEDLASRTPNAFLKLMGVEDANVQTPAPTKSTVNQQALAVHPSGQSAPAPDTFKHFEAMRRGTPEQRKQYWTPEVQNRMHKVAQEKGAAFYK